MNFKKILAAVSAVSILTCTCFQTMVYAEDETLAGVTAVEKEDTSEKATDTAEEDKASDEDTSEEVTDTAEEDKTTEGEASEEDADTSEEEDDPAEDTDDDAVYYNVTYDGDGGVGTITPPVPTKAGDMFKTSLWALKKEGLSHQGWSDGETVYKRGSSFVMPDHDVVLTAVYVKNYKVEFEDFEANYGLEWPLTNKICLPGTEVYLPNYGVFNGDKMFNGWLVNGVHYDPLTTLITPAEDVFIEVDWLAPIEFTLFAGDVDGVVTEPRLYLKKYAGAMYDLPDGDRMSRLGYKLTGWTDTSDGKEYPLEAPYKIPENDVVLQAIWTPITVAVRYSGGTGAAGTMERQKMPYDSIFELPECGFTKEGYKLLGWKLRDEYYQPEATVQIKIADFGESPQFVAQWIEEDLNPGDLNDDGICDLSDMTILSQILLKDLEPTEDQEKNADVFRDGVIDTSDIASYKQFIMKDRILLGLKGE